MFIKSLSLNLCLTRKCPFVDSNDTCLGEDCMAWVKEISNVYWYECTKCGHIDAKTQRRQTGCRECNAQINFYDETPESKRKGNCSFRMK